MRHYDALIRINELPFDDIIVGVSVSLYALRFIYLNRWQRIVIIIVVTARYYAFPLHIEQIFL